jgi:hypothetical protein
MHHSWQIKKCGGDCSRTAIPALEVRSATTFRPTVRPPVAMLMVFDDGKTDGELIRIRDHRFIIGRSD